MIADTIPKVERPEGNLHESSYFEVYFKDGSMVSEKNTNWSALSEEANVKIMGGTKTVFLSTKDVASMKVYHKGLETDIAVPEGCRIYQSIKGMASFMSTGQRMDNNTAIGRFVGIVKDGEVIEERYLDGQGNNVIGFKK